MHFTAQPYAPYSLLLPFVVGMVKQVVGRKLLVLIAGKIGLYNEVALKAKTTELCI